MDEKACILAVKELVEELRRKGAENHDIIRALHEVKEEVKYVDWGAEW